MFNDIQKHIQEKNEKEAKKAQEEAMLRVKGSAEEIVKLLKGKGLSVSEALFSLEAATSYVQGQTGRLPLVDVVKE